MRGRLQSPLRSPKPFQGEGLRRTLGHNRSERNEVQRLVLLAFTIGALLVGAVALGVALVLGVSS